MKRRLQSGIRKAVVGMAWSCLLWGSAAVCQERAVSVHVKVQDGEAAVGHKELQAEKDASEVVIWLKPLDLDTGGANPAQSSGKKVRVVQKNKSFQPHLTVVRVGSVVEFPNHDPFFHNVFSLFDGKRFDLGLYEAGATNSVRFDHVGVSYLFCNIHPEMSAVVVAVDSSYYGISSKTGLVNIAGVPDGRYEMHVWYERGVQDELKGLTRAVRISAETRDLGLVAVVADPAFTPAHKNKYGQDYAPPPKGGYSPQ